MREEGRDRGGRTSHVGCTFHNWIQGLEGSWAPSQAVRQKLSGGYSSVA